MRHEQIAVGAYDPYVRLYDARILSLSHPSTEVSDRPDPGCIAHYAPGHISQSFRKFPPTSNQSSNSTIASTFVSFSPSGNELLANLSSEQVYLFSTIHQQPVLTYTVNNSDPFLFHKPSYSPIPIQTTPTNESNVSDQVVCLRDAGNELFKGSKYTEAIEYYSTAILMNPSWYVLYSNRATAHMKRNWSVDV